MNDIPSIPTPQRTRKRSGPRFDKEQRKQRQEVFLQALSMTANVRAACMRADIDRSTVYYWQEHDEDFSMRFHVAQAEANDILFGEAWRRAVQGIEKPVVSRGDVVYDKEGKMVTTKEYSDNLLALLLKARLPEFRDKQQIEVSGKDGGPIAIETQWGTTKVHAESDE